MQSSRAFIWVVTPRCLVWQFTGFKSFYKYIVTTGLVWQFAGFIWVVTTGLVTGTPINNWKFKNKRNSCFILLLVSLFIVCGCWVDPGDFERFFDFECLPVRRNRRLHTTETTGSQGQWLMVDIRRMYEELCNVSNILWNAMCSFTCLTVFMYFEWFVVDLSTIWAGSTLGDSFATTPDFTSCPLIGQSSSWWTAAVAPTRVGTDKKSRLCTHPNKYKYIYKTWFASACAVYSAQHQRLGALHL